MFYHSSERRCNTFRLAERLRDTGTKRQISGKKKWAAYKPGSVSYLLYPEAKIYDDSYSSGPDFTIRLGATYLWKEWEPS